VVTEGEGANVECKEHAPARVPATLDAEVALVLLAYLSEGPAVYLSKMQENAQLPTEAWQASDGAAGKRFAETASRCIDKLKMTADHKGWMKVATRGSIHTLV